MPFSEIIKLQFGKICYMLFALKLFRGICYLIVPENAWLLQFSFFFFFFFVFSIPIALMKICLSLMVHGHKQLKNTSV